MVVFSRFYDRSFAIFANIPLKVRLVALQYLLKQD
jgi:hypothetical protein